MRRRTMLVCGCTLALLLGTIPSPASAATARDFFGVWTSVDAVDASDQLMVITPRGRIVLIDAQATACDGAPAIVTGQGTIVGDDLDATLRLNCVGGGVTSGIPATFTYDASTDTLTDSLGGTVWSSLGA